MNSELAKEFETVTFWGKITGLVQDYFIAMGITHTGKYEFPTKCFFYATSSAMTFKQVPELND